MMHTTRAWLVTPIGPAELVDRLTREPCTVTAGFLCDDVWWLNDSLSEDAPQVFAAVRRGDDGAWRQLDTFTVSWMAHEWLAARLDHVPALTGWPIEEPNVRMALPFA